MIYDIPYKTLIDPKPLCIRFDKIVGFTRMYDETIYLALLDSEKYDSIYDRIRYKVYISYKSKKWHQIYFSHFVVKIKVDSCDYLPIEKILTLHNVIILIKSGLTKDKILLLKGIFRKMLVSISLNYLNN